MQTPERTNKLYLLAINLTRRCNLACEHCYLDARTLACGSDDELTTSEVRELLEQVAQRSLETMVVLTGGEPLMRPDLEAILSHGAALGLAMVVGSNGIALTERRVLSMKESGALGVGISLDSLDPVYHDEFRGVSGAWERTLAGIEACRRNDFSFQIHFSVTDRNAHELADMVEFSRATGARVLNVFFLVCTGRGESMSDISPQSYEKVLRELVELQSQVTDLIIRARCAPHFKRLAYQGQPDSQLNRIAGGEGDGCIAGTHYCRITPEGGVTACPYIEKELGNVRDGSFLPVWDSSPDLERLRSARLMGKCGECEYRRLCGGCRARPVARGDDLMGADPLCAYVPRGGAVIVPLTESETSGVEWTDAARQRLQRVPAFLRRLVKKRAEAYVTELGESLVTPDHLSVLAARRFGHSGPSRPNQEVQ